MKNLTLVLLLTIPLFYFNCAKVNPELLSEVDPLQQSEGEESQAQYRIVDYSDEIKFDVNASKEIDIILIIDNSGSMKGDSQKLAEKLQGFVDEIASMDVNWQMCLVTTDYKEEGWRPRNWKDNVSPKHILKKGTSQLASKFENTIDDMSFGRDGTGDERGTAVLYEVIKRKENTGCLRDNTHWVSIIISDEDVRSVGGDESYGSSQLKELSDIDLPIHVLDYARSNMTSGNSLSFFSIIVKDKDMACKVQQDDQCDYENGKSKCPAFFGRHYQKFSDLTRSSVGSICQSDYSVTLKDFSQDLSQKLSHIQLKCEPYLGVVQVEAITPTSIEWHLDGASIVIDSEIQGALEINISYQCRERIN